MNMQLKYMGMQEYMMCSQNDCHAVFREASSIVNVGYIEVLIMSVNCSLLNYSA